MFPKKHSSEKIIPLSIGLMLVKKKADHLSPSPPLCEKSLREIDGGWSALSSRRTLTRKRPEHHLQCFLTFGSIIKSQIYYYKYTGQHFGDVVPTLVPSCSLLDTDPHTRNSWDTKLSLRIRKQSRNPSHRLCLVSNQLHNLLSFISLSTARMISIPDVSDFKDDDLSKDWVITRRGGNGECAKMGLHRYCLWISVFILTTLKGRKNHNGNADQSQSYELSLQSPRSFSLLRSMD